MALHPLSAAKLAPDLADDCVGPRDQAIYFAMTFIVWLVPGYFFLPGLASPEARAISYAEFVALAIVNVAGAYYCLRQCRVDPKRHFLIDTSCLMAPITLVVLAATWLAFYAVLGMVMAWWPYAWPASRFERVHDALIFLVVIGQLAWIYHRTGKYVARVAEMRSSPLAPSPAAVTLG